jgi:hypothetical protein
MKQNSKVVLGLLSIVALLFLTQLNNQSVISVFSEIQTDVNNYNSSFILDYTQDYKHKMGIYNWSVGNSQYPTPFATDSAPTTRNVIANKTYHLLVFELNDDNSANVKYTYSEQSYMNLEFWVLCVTTNNAWHFTFVDNGKSTVGQIRFGIDGSVKFYTDEYKYTASEDKTYSANIWYHVRFEHTYQSTIRLYFNHTLCRTGSDTLSAKTDKFTLDVVDDSASESNIYVDAFSSSVISYVAYTNNETINPYFYINSNFTIDFNSISNSFINLTLESTSFNDTNYQISIYDYYSNAFVNITDNFIELDFVMFYVHTKIILINIYAYNSLNSFYVNLTTITTIFYN